MQAQISMERTNTNMQILADFANGGDLIPIDVKLREQIASFLYYFHMSGRSTRETSHSTVRMLKGQLGTF